MAILNFLSASFDVFICASVAQYSALSTTSSTLLRSLYEWIVCSCSRVKVWEILTNSIARVRYSLPLFLICLKNADPSKNSSFALVAPNLDFALVAPNLDFALVAPNFDFARGTFGSARVISGSTYDIGRADKATGRPNDLRVLRNPESAIFALSISSSTSNSCSLGRSFKTNPSGTDSRALDSLTASEEPICNFFAAMNGSRSSCHSMLSSV
ncbi:hypothetical protein BJV77DRAFT_982674 [Russula vinacea]|nr:hypothetical protein BJV77DRAFT_982674 [Russula vinacea]